MIQGCDELEVLGRAPSRPSTGPATLAATEHGAPPGVGAEQHLLAHTDGLEVVSRMIAGSR